MKQALKTARFATDNEEIQGTVLKRVAGLMQEISFEDKPPQIAHRVHRIVREITKNPDPYQELKKQDNEFALKLYPELKSIINSSDDPLYTAVKLAVAGNIIDYGVDHVFDIEETIGEVLRKDFAIDCFNAFKKDLNSARTITYLADNAGELVMDRLLIEQLKDKEVTLVVKGGPIINDATLDDVKQIGLENKVHIQYLGNGDKGTGPERSDPEFLQKLRSADIVISKGQGNYEGLSNQEHIYFLLMAKCPLIARHIQVNPKDIVFCKGRKK